MSKETYHTQISISALDVIKCTHKPGARDGLPCAFPGCTRGDDAIVLERGEKRYRRRIVDQRTIRDGEIVSERVPVWVEIE